MAFAFIVNCLSFFGLFHFLLLLLFVSVTTYLISVVTGNLWNGGTTANIYLTLFGELGDSGPRLLQHGGRADPQLKGRVYCF